MSTYAIKGIPLPAKPDPHHPIPLRQEITKWSSDPDNAVQLSLFIQALLKFQQMPINDKLSYFQVAGIHGYPATSWDNARSPDPGWFYCNHQLTTFPTWHRPYMLLFEQRLYEIMMKEVVSKVQPESEKQVWEIEASQWRLPYWDWAMSQPYLQNVGVPLLFTMERITVLMPGRRSQNFPNPLARFSNPSGVPMGDGSMGKWAIPDSAWPWSACVGTSRYGIHHDNPTQQEALGINNFQGSNRAIQAHEWGGVGFGPNASIHDLVSRLLSDNYLKSWRTFASTAHLPNGPAPPTDFLSLEGIHNNLHTFTGGSDASRQGLGHMCDPAIASFDPIFFLHHCNVDRLFAMWQALNPQKWFDNLDPRDNGPSIKLTPFHKDTNGNLYDSNDCRNWTSLGYQYDTLENTPPWVRAELAVQGVTEHQHPNTSSDHAPTVPDHVAAHVRRSVNMHFNVTRDAVLASPKIKGTDNDYLINVVYDRYALSGRAYSLYFFIGHVPVPAASSSTPGFAFGQLPSYVGKIYTFSTPLELESSTGGCENCRKQKKEGVLSKGQVPITPALLDHCANPDIPEIETMDPGAVEAYLRTHLSWVAVEAISGHIIPLAQLPRTKIYVMGGKAEHSTDPAQLSRYSDYAHLWGPTDGKEGGARRGDEGVHVEL